MSQEIRVGQRWRSKDKRDNGRTVIVLSHDDGINDPGSNGFVVVQWARKSTMRAHTLRTRYVLVGDPR